MGKGANVPQSSINAQAGLASSLGNLANIYAGQAGPNITSASDYWQKLLGSPQAQQQALGPSEGNISQAYQGAKQTIQNTLPQGGEKNLALAQLPTAQAGSIAQLYQGLGPQAATQLGNLGLGVGGLGVGSGGVGAQAGGTLTSLAGQQSLAKGQALGGLGQGLGAAAGGYLGNKA